jgi:hypothetical protein
MNIISWIKSRGWLPPETVGPIKVGQVWTYVPFNLRFGNRQDRYFVTVFRVENNLIWFSMIPGPRYQDVAVIESEFRKLFRLVPDINACPKPTEQRQ